MLHGTIRNDNFSAKQHYNIVATLFRMLATLFHHCYAVLDGVNWQMAKLLTDN